MDELSLRSNQFMFSTLAINVVEFVEYTPNENRHITTFNWLGLETPGGFAQKSPQTWLKGANYT
jgi:hypothetical protein